MGLTLILDPDFLKLGIDNSGMPNTLEIDEGVKLTFDFLLGYNESSKKWIPVLVDSDGQVQVNSVASTVESVTQSKVEPTSSNTLMLAANSSRKLFVVNNFGTETVYLNLSSNDADTDDFPLKPDTIYVETNWKGEVNSITASGTGDLRVMEYV